MNNDIWVMAAIAVLVLLVSVSRTSAAAGNGVGMPIIGNGGTIWTGDSQFFYDGEFWYKLGPSGYFLIDGQPNG